METYVNILETPSGQEFDKKTRSLVVDTGNGLNFHFLQFDAVILKAQAKSFFHQCC